MFRSNPAAEAIDAVDRAALRCPMLVADHLGAYVRPRSEHESADLFELRVSAESTAARLAAERRTAGQLDALALIVDAQEVATAAVDLASRSRPRDGGPRRSGAGTRSTPTS